MLRKHMKSVIPRDHALWKTWLSNDSLTVPSKCLMRMRMRDSYSEVRTPFYSMAYSFLCNWNADGVQCFPKHDSIPTRRGEKEYVALP